MAFLFGAVSALLLLFLYRNASQRVLVRNAYLALAIMLAIYLGAHLVSSDLQRIIFETVFASAILVGAAWLIRIHPVNIASLIILHGAYDVMFGHDSGIADWYVPMCLGFDVVLGIGLIYLIAKQKRLHDRPN